MKTKTTTSLSQKKTTRKSLVVLSVLVALFGSLAHFSPVRADSYDDQITALQSEVDNFQAQAAKLAQDASSLQQAIDGLTAQKNALQAQIDLSQAKYNKLLDDIKATKKKLSDQQDVLSSTIADMSAGSQTTPIEVLAGSNSVGDYVSSQDYYLSIQDQLQASITDVIKLQKQLDQQKTDVEQVLADQQKQRDALGTKEAEQAKLLADTQGQQSAYETLVTQKQGQIADVRSQQAAAMRSTNGAENVTYGSSSYPWMDSSMSYNDSCIYYSGGSAADPWGYCKRQCVSYVAWKLNTDGRGNRGYSSLGNASGWGYAGAYVPVSDIQTGDVIVWYIGYYGHVMYVESVDGNNVNISQMNVPYDSGSYSTANYSKTTLSNGSYTVRRFH